MLFNKYNKTPTRTNDPAQPRISIFQDVGPTHMQKMKNKIFERLKNRRQQIFKKTRERRLKDQTEDDFSDFIKQTILDRTENEKIICEALYEEENQADTEEMYDFCAQILTEYEHFVENDPEIDYKIENIDAASEIFSPKKDFNMGSDFGNEELMEDFQQIEELQLQLEDCHSMYTFTDEKGYSQSRYNCPICGSIIQCVQGYLACEESNCIDLDVADIKGFELPKFSERVVEKKIHHLDTSDDYHSEFPKMVVSIDRDEEHGMTWVQIDCKECNKKLFVDID
ncbi:unnamed protein product [Moneuplotes crassus]|uniref:Uncharacterized protein n=1 Tax=Euplotes crassus TaxID=5936 RepID=A0AAD1UPW5_EUPCR|nr:unnamed protein product [Moneuplotes crassus]